MSSGNLSTYWHRRLLEGRSVLFAVLTTVAVSIGGIVEIVPMFTVDSHHETAVPYTALEVAGRDIYVREGCYVCHSQMVRPFRDETLRYGAWSRSEEYAYDRPFQLGSRRIGPDLHRVGGKYPDAWHYEHMKDPRSTSPGSLMPAYSWLLDRKLDPADVQASMKALQRVGTPYTDEQVEQTAQAIQTQGSEVVARLSQAGVTAAPDDEIVAMIAYLQRLGHTAEEPVAQKDGGS